MDKRQWENRLSRNSIRSRDDSREFSPEFPRRTALHQASRQLEQIFPVSMNDVKIERDISSFVSEEKYIMAMFDDVLGAANDLTPSDRIRLLGALWDTVPPEQWPAPSAAWLAEVKQRSDDHDANDSPASSWEEVRQRARREAGLDE